MKNKSAGGKYQFGAAHSATTPLFAPAPIEGDTKVNNTPMGLEAFNRYFHNLAAAATNEKGLLK